MSVFTKGDLKTAYHQIPIDHNFKEVMAINMLIYLLKLKRMSYGIKIASIIFQSAIEQVLLVFANVPGFNPRSSHIKDSKMVLDATLLSTQPFKVRIG